ncbi:MAG: transcriptional regulator [Gammaproteobacteria bacterium CG22_combo_CG10-13_8_21_14_all_40_8]|nr:MAG: transcriptional regulator [Gammaproteobacteria bacterium CG22_combo_CG10-13_8_21_14_all_40_8]
MSVLSQTKDKILYLLKSRGGCTSQFLAKELELTSMGARQQLLKLTEAGQITSFLKSEGIGRPKRYWYLTQKGQANFPDRHADLTLELIESVKILFGETGLEKLVKGRESKSLDRYLNAVQSVKGLTDKVNALAHIRTEEGYMTEVQSVGENFMLLENHCPIWATAKQCQSFCRSELAMFQQVLGDMVQVERTEHRIAGARRCAYKISPKIGNNE